MSTQTSSAAKQPQLHVYVADDAICGNSNGMEGVAPAPERAGEALCKPSTTIDGPALQPPCTTNIPSSWALSRVFDLAAVKRVLSVHRSIYCKNRVFEAIAMDK
ncbi:hypothetical protein CGLO_01647 [Colletotrichum gloeosporioides Cg-14]|uniref:Uncharacterized protein n=1 Tax=Colletotrichum gloeosporioides (strain Cg-14) TaxID=1237896 RepID=T0KRG9_COLGC|nr:hypothetical protein CGLO_01647 [Colletotrichum gloeosporioides Cg-14]